jgi:hypothetical protein
LNFAIRFDRPESGGMSPRVTDTFTITHIAARPLELFSERPAPTPLLSLTFYTSYSTLSFYISRKDLLHDLRVLPIELFQHIGRRRTLEAFGSGVDSAVQSPVLALGRAEQVAAVNPDRGVPGNRSSWASSSVLTATSSTPTPMPSSASTSRTVFSAAGYRTSFFGKYLNAEGDGFPRRRAVRLSRLITAYALSRA